MFINQVNASGNFYTSNVNSDNVSATNVSATNLTTLTFSPTNVNASVLIANEGDIYLMNSSTINASNSNISTQTSNQINTNNVSSVNVSSIQVLTDDLILPSNGAYNDASIQTLTDQLTIRAGAGNSIGFKTDTDVNMVYDGNLNLSTNLNVSYVNTDTQLNVLNSTGKKFAIEHVADDIRFYGAKNNNSQPSNYLFHTDAGGGFSRVKLKINKDTDVVEVVSLEASSDILTGEIVCDTINVSDLDALEVNTSEVNSSSIIANFMSITDINTSLITSNKFSGNVSANNISAINLNISTLNTSTKNASTINVSITNSSFISTATIESDGLDFTKNGIIKMVLESNGTLTIDDGTSNGNDRLKVYENHDEASAVIGNLRLGNVELFANWVGMSHKNMSQDVAGQYAIIQSTAGETRVNAKSGQKLSLCNNNTVHMTVDTNGVNISQLNSSNCSFTNVSVDNISVGLVFTSNLINSENYELHDSNLPPTNSMSDYWTSTGDGPDGIGADIIYPAFKKLSGTMSDYNILNMMAFNNDATPANRFIEVPCDFNVSLMNFDLIDGDTIDSNTLNSSTINCSVLNASSIDLPPVQNTSTINCSTVNSSMVNSSNMDIAGNTDITAIVGRAKIGYNSTDVDMACFAHYDNMTSTNYGLRQNATGSTYINAPTTQSVNLQINDVPKLIVNPDGDVNVQDNLEILTGNLQVNNGTLIVDPDTDNVVAEIGRAKIGYNGSNSNTASFSHYNNMTGTGYALRQNFQGKTTINSKSGQDILFCINNSVKASVHPSGNFVANNNCFVLGTLAVQTVSPNTSYALHVNGKSFLRDGFDQNSDDRIKNNEEHITNALDTIMKLKPQTYDKTQTNDEGDYTEIVRESGLIAQDIYYDTPELKHIVKLPSDTTEENILPRPEEKPTEGGATNIQEDPDYGSLGWGEEMSAVSYTQLIPWLIKGMQEQQQTIQDLKTRLTNAGL